MARAARETQAIIRTRMMAFFYARKLRIESRELRTESTESCELRATAKESNADCLPR